MENTSNSNNKKLDFLALDLENPFNNTSNNDLNSNYRVSYNYFGIKSGISYDNHEDLSFWEY